ncbi:hypothetical protein ZIOFF_061353 [Zingiber officinale]|uniref:BHLH domain-containing protein n=1 Tax=Zingiber officinale TaxID=94328 RepID=A0A8J5EZH0_ZINOF|nr:hypothetical protein ZIOFF_061353 [Zingiber officinale]
MQCLQTPVPHRFSSKWQQQEQPSHHSYSADDLCVQGFNSFDCFSNGLSDLPDHQYPGFEEITSEAVSDSTLRKRKAETSPKSKQDCKIRVKQETGGAKTECKQQNSSKEASGDGSKTDYIHVRARRGQATDSHSLAERVRRERISQRMKCLQELVPGCSKITGKAGMLDEIINYVQSLQRQVELVEQFLSMKLAAVNPVADIDFLSREAMSTQLVQINPPELMDQPFLHFNSLQLDPCLGLDMYMDSSDLVADGSPFGSSLNSLHRVEFLQSLQGKDSYPICSSGMDCDAWFYVPNKQKNKIEPFLLHGNLLPNNLKMEI